MTPRRIKIRQPYFGAGSPKQFNWIKDDYHIFGVGVNVRYLNNYDVLEIVVNNKAALVKTQDIKNFANKYNSYKNIRNSVVKVAIFSMSLIDPSLHAKKKLSVLGTKQLKLF
jgi:hypothetical protein